VVHGIVRDIEAAGKGWLRDYFLDPSIYQKRLFFHHISLFRDSEKLENFLVSLDLDEIYHLAGQSSVGLSFANPALMSQDLSLMIRLLEASKVLEKSPRLFHASSSEIYGKNPVVPQTEETPHSPVSPYGASKAFCTNIVKIYRESYGLFLVNGIMYNHESPRRGNEFITKKICKSAALISVGLQDRIVMGRTEYRRDWGHAKDYVQGMWLSLQSTRPEDFIFSSGRDYSLEDVLDMAFLFVGLDWRNYYVYNPRFDRPVQPSILRGDSSKARSCLGWVPEYALKETIEEMVMYELEHCYMQGK